MTYGWSSYWNFGFSLEGGSLLVEEKALMVALRLRVSKGRVVGVPMRLVSLSDSCNSFCSRF
jgi:hypothetical protein